MSRDLDRSEDLAFTPALGRVGATPLYDRALQLFTREQTWRRVLLRLVAVTPGERILHVGCGTGTFAITLAQQAPGIRIVGLDPDPEALAIAAGKARRERVDIEWRRGFARDAGGLGTFDAVVSSLVFHQVPSAKKRAGVAAMFAAVRPRGRIRIADYARQPGALMRALFGSIQLVDGRANTQANVDGAIEVLLHELTGRPVAACEIVRTPTGAISLFAAERA